MLKVIFGNNRNTVWEYSILSNTLRNTVLKCELRKMYIFIYILFYNIKTQPRHWVSNYVMFVFKYELNDGPSRRYIIMSLWKTIVINNMYQHNNYEKKNDIMNIKTSFDLHFDPLH